MSPISERQADATAARSSVMRDVPHWVAVVAVVAASVVMVTVQWESVGPQFANDEIGNLASAMLFAHPNTTWLLTGWAYMPGMSIILTPVWWITSDPSLAFRLAILLCAFVAVLAIAPLAELARRFGAQPRWSVVFASIVVVAPSRALNSNYVWAENALFLCVAWTIALAFRLAERPSAKTAVAYGAISAGAFAAHGRALPFAGIALVVGTLLVWKHRPLGARLVITWLVVAVGSYLLFRYVSQEIYVASQRESSTLRDLSRVTPSGYAVTAVSQVWYQVAAWAGLTVVGAATLLARARLERWRGAATAVAVAVSAMALSVPLLTANSPDGAIRMEVHFYGRYADAFVAPLAVIGLARLMRPIALRAKALLALTYLGSAIAFLVVCVPSIPRGSSLTPIHAPGVAYLLHPEYPATGGVEDWTWVAMVAVAPALVLLALSWWRYIAFTALGVWFASVTVVTDHVQYDRLEHDSRQPLLIVQTMHGIDTDIPLYAEPTSLIPLRNGNRITFWLNPRAYIYMDTSKDTSAVQMFFGKIDSTFAAAHHALPLADSRVATAVIWIMPGPLQDRLALEGRLDPLPNP